MIYDRIYVTNGYDGHTEQQVQDEDLFFFREPTHHRATGSYIGRCGIIPTTQNILGYFCGGNDGTPVGLARIQVEAGTIGS